MTTINSYDELKNFLNQILKDNGQYDDTEGAVHHAFWNSMTYVEFTTGKVPRVGARILIPGDPDDSNLIQVLKGTSDKYPQMPADGPPYFTGDQVDSVYDWIKRNCPNN
jgi:hypothetical protein